MPNLTYKKYKKEILKDPRVKKLNFEPDGRIHYVYRVTHVKDQKHYYGSKTEQFGIKETTIGRGYFTSSSNKNFQQGFKKNPSLYYFKIIKYFNNNADKIIFESYLHQKFNVKLNLNFINKMNCTPFGIDNTGNLCSDKTKEKMSVSTIKNSADIDADPIRKEKRRKSLIKMHAKIKADPIRKENRRKNQSLAAFRAQAEIKLNLDKYKRRCKKSSDSHSVAICQFDENWHYVATYKGAAAAAQILGYPNNANIIAALTGRRPHHKKQHWVLEKDYIQNPKLAMERAKCISKMHKKPIFHIDNFGNIIQEFKSAALAGKKFKINPAIIVKILAGYNDSTEKFKEKFILKDTNEKTTRGNGVG